MSVCGEFKRVGCCQVQKVIESQRQTEGMSERDRLIE